jgi:hypothetical protein
MAQRLATEYVKAFLQLSRNQLDQLIKIFSEHLSDLIVEEKPNAVHLSFRDYEAKVTLAFKKMGIHYVCQHPYRIQNHTLANLMRQVVSTFKGDAIVNRIYSNYVMVYHYNHGSVVKITEVKDSHERLVYEFKNKALELQTLFDKTGVEEQIRFIRHEINRLLDLRNDADQSTKPSQIDEQLKMLSHQLFVLEA